MAYEELYPTKGPPPMEPKIVVAPADVDVSPQVSVHYAAPDKFPVFFGARIVAQQVQDLLMKKMQTEDIALIASKIPELLSTGFSAADAAKKAGDTGDVVALKAAIDRIYKGLYDNWVAGTWKGVGGAYSSAMDNFINTGQLIYAYKTLAYHTAITPRMKRYWSSVYTPTVPNSTMAFNLLMRGKISEDQFKKYASYDGWDAKGTQYLKDLWTNVPNTYATFLLLMRGSIKPEKYKEWMRANGWPEELETTIFDLYKSLPTAREAFYMFQKGLINKAKRDDYYTANGYHPEIHSLLTDNYMTLPSAREAFHMWMKGLIDQKTKTSLYLANGYDQKWHSKLTDNFKLIPTAHEAFYMWRKGLISEKTRNKVYQWQGYDPMYFPAMTENWMYTPTIYDLTRLADYVELDPIWAMDVMKRRGVRDADVAKIWEMIQLRPLKKNVEDITDTWIWRAKYGRATIETLTDEFTDMGIRDKQKELLLEKAQMDYEDELITEWIEVLRWRFRTAIISENEFLQGLIETGIREEKANIMVELEKAKGYYGYY